MSTKKKHAFHIEDRDYSSVEVAEMVGRDKSRINQLARRFAGWAHREVHGRMVIWKFSPEGVNHLLNWMADNGHPLSEESKQIQVEKFNGSGRYSKT